jgi:hypothetical protein
VRERLTYVRYPRSRCGADMDTSDVIDLRTNSVTCTRRSITLLKHRKASNSIIESCRRHEHSSPSASAAVLYVYAFNFCLPCFFVFFLLPSFTLSAPRASSSCILQRAFWERCFVNDTINLRDQPAACCMLWDCNQLCAICGVGMQSRGTAIVRGDTYVASYNGILF